jgi:hypothetical protein
MLAKKYFVYLPKKKGIGRSLQAQLMRGGWGTHSWRALTKKKNRRNSNVNQAPHHRQLVLRQQYQVADEEEEEEE